MLGLGMGICRRWACVRFLIRQVLTLRNADLLWDWRRSGRFRRPVIFTESRSCWLGRLFIID